MAKYLQGFYGIEVESDDGKLRYVLRQQFCLVGSMERVFYTAHAFVREESGFIRCNGQPFDTKEEFLRRIFGTAGFIQAEKEYKQSNEQTV